MGKEISRLILAWLNEYRKTRVAGVDISWPETHRLDELRDYLSNELEQADAE